VTPKIIRFWDGDRYDVGLLFKTDDRFAYVIPMDVAGLRVVKLDADKELEFEYVPRSMDALKRDIIRFANIARTGRTTEEAKRALTKIAEAVSKMK
jgi:hypothetical protein